MYPFNFLFATRAALCRPSLPPYRLLLLLSFPSAFALSSAAIPLAPLSRPSPRDASRRVYDRFDAFSRHPGARDASQFLRRARREITTRARARTRVRRPARAERAPSVLESLIRESFRRRSARIASRRLSVAARETSDEHRPDRGWRTTGRSSTRTDGKRGEPG